MDYSLTIWSIASYIEARINQDIHYEDLEKVMGFSYRHLREVFKETTDIPLSKYILSRRIANAAFDIIHTDCDLTHISERYGFGSYDAFTRAFRRITGKNPSAFRKASCKVGRRRLLMGIYGPMIYREDELFQLQHPILEVDSEMSKRVEKQDNGCTLYGVPKVAYTYEECTPFPTALKACLKYMGQEVDYAYIMAASGAAFRLRWNLEFWDGGNVDIMYVYDDPFEAFHRAFRGVGRDYRILTREEGDKEAFKSMIVDEIDAGRPVIAFGIIGPPEACVVTGYREKGERLLGWNCFQDNKEFNKGVTYEECGYFNTGEWWNHETKAIIAIGEEVSEKDSLVSILSNAIQILSKEEISHKKHVINGGSLIAGGQKAYDAWAKAISEDGEFSQETILPMLIERLMCQNDAQVMIAEGRSYGACFTSYIGKAYPEVASQCEKVADLFRKEAKCAMDMNGLKGGFEQGEEAVKSFAKPEVRKAIVPLIMKAKEYDRLAKEGLEEILKIIEVK